MRVISGKNKGKTIRMPKGIRPTSNKVRKAVFDILGDIKGLTFLELFAGSGAVGLEALSYGAQRVVFVERDERCTDIIRDNLSGEPRLNYNLYETDAFKALKELSGKRIKFDLVFLDPPYTKSLFPRPYAKLNKVGSGLAERGHKASLAKKTLKMLAAYDILAPLGFIIVQHHRKEILPQEIDSLIFFKGYSYGDTVLSFYKIKG
jgi:16S rRNA (guanine966-N2)-methyltransferase